MGNAFTTIKVKSDETVSPVCTSVSLPWTFTGNLPKGVEVLVVISKLLVQIPTRYEVGQEAGVNLQLTPAGRLAQEKAMDGM